MSPTQQFHAKQEQHDGGAYDHSPPLKIKDSNFIHRLPPPPSSTGSSTNDAIPPTNKSHQPQSPPPPPRRPVIIYTHSPKVIHTHPRDFMALVQKLTGYTPPPEDPQQQRVGPQRNVEDNESANSVLTEEHGTSVNDIIGPPPPQMNSCFVDNNGINIVAPPHYNFNPSPPPPPPVFQTNSTDFLCTPSHHHQLPFYNPDSMFMNWNSLSSSSSSLRFLKEYPDI